MTLPNLITCLRIILVPIFVIYVIHDRLLPALVVFAIAGVSDGVDGFVARVFNQKSKLGSYLDPLADKFLLVAAFITLAIRDLLPPWLMVIVISRDVLILLGVLILFLMRVEIIIRPSILSKVNTCMQLVSVFVVLCRDHLPLIAPLSGHIFWLTGALTIGSGLHYMRFWLRTMSDNPLNQAGTAGGDQKERPDGMIGNRDEEKGRNTG